MIDSREEFKPIVAARKLGKREGLLRAAEICAAYYRPTMESSRDLSYVEKCIRDEVAALTADAQPVGDETDCDYRKHECSNVGRTVNGKWVCARHEKRVPAIPAPEPLVYKDADAPSLHSWEHIEAAIMSLAVSATGNEERAYAKQLHSVLTARERVTVTRVADYGEDQPHFVVWLDGKPEINFAHEEQATRYANGLRQELAQHKAAKEGQ
jgi:hypothetical protein